jgi:hypothetical protein
MGEVALIMGDIGLRERLAAEINAFNVAAAWLRRRQGAEHRRPRRRQSVVRRAARMDVGRPRLH